MTRKMVHHYRAEARRVIWDLRDNRPEGETLPMALQDVLRNVTETRGIDAEVLVEGAERELPIDIQHNVLRICQEAVSNAARHGSPARIRITLAYDADRLTATVWDNGRGFPVEESRNAAAGHYGMTVMNERARRYGGSVTVESHPGRGTTVQASIPLAGANRS